jgi:uncharacterized protein
LTAGQEREDFAQQINRQLGIPAPRADDWNTLLWSVADRTRTGRHLIVLDEINWLGSKDPTFLGKLKNAWDAEFSQNPHLILILSGSLSGWIERNILHHTGFLGRVSMNFTLPELPLATCNLFWGKHRDRITPHEKLRLLSVTGGVPRYLEEMNPTLSADVNIQRMCFTPEGLLFKEFDLIFHDLFSRRDKVYREIVAALVNGSLDPERLYAALGVGKTGKIGEYSADLVQAGFGILGLQFENIVLKNRLAIFERLHIDPNDVLYDNPFFQRKTLRHAGCQIDNLIQIRQKTLYICEIKFSKNAVPLSVISEVREKIARLSMPRRMNYRPVLIHAGAIAESIAEQDYFASVIDVGELDGFCGYLNIGTDSVSLQWLLAGSQVLRDATTRVESQSPCQPILPVNCCS